MKEIFFEILIFKLFLEYVFIIFVYKLSLLDVKFIGYFMLFYFCGGFYSLYCDNFRVIVFGIFRVVYYGFKVIWDFFIVYYIICFFFEVFFCF